LQKETKDLAATLITTMPAPSTTFYDGANTMNTPKTTCLRPNQDRANNTGLLSSTLLTSQTHTQVVAIIADLKDIGIGDVDFFPVQGKEKCALLIKALSADGGDHSVVLRLQTLGSALAGANGLDGSDVYAAFDSQCGLGKPSKKRVRLAKLISASLRTSGALTSQLSLHWAAKIM
jgi:hypothetical protein